MGKFVFIYSQLSRCVTGVLQLGGIVWGYSSEVPLRLKLVSIFYSLYWPQVGRRTSDSNDVRRSFLWSVGLSVGGESDGGGHCRTADGGRTEVLISL